MVWGLEFFLLPYTPIFRQWEWWQSSNLLPWSELCSSCGKPAIKQGRDIYQCKEVCVQRAMLHRALAQEEPLYCPPPTSYYTHTLKVIRAHYCTLCFSVSHTKEPFSPLLPYQKRAANHSLNVHFNTCFHLNGMEEHQTIKYLTRKCMKWKHLNIMC